MPACTCFTLHVHALTLCIVCSPLTIIQFLFSISVPKMFEVANNLRNICDSIPVTHSMAIVCSVRVLLCSAAGWIKPAWLESHILNEPCFLNYLWKTRGMAPKPCLDRPDFILSSNMEEDWSLTEHVYSSVPVFKKCFHQFIQVGWSKTCSIKINRRLCNLCTSNVVQSLHVLP